MMNKFQKSSRTKRYLTRLIPGGVATVDIKRKIREILPIVFGTILLGLWINIFNITDNQYMLREALICSSIIFALLFFRAAGPRGDVNNEF